MSGSESQVRLTQLRRLLAGQRIYTEEFVLARCQSAYGRPITPRTWRRWLSKVRAEADPVELGGMSEATYLLLLTLAGLLRGNAESRSQNKVPVTRLIDVVEMLLSGSRPFDVPQTISYTSLKQLAELRSLRSYSDRYHRASGLKKTQAVYSKSEALEILNHYPDFSYVYQQQQTG